MKVESVHPTHLNKIFLGKRHPSRKLALELEQATKIHRLAWLYPEEFFNPEVPHLYNGIYPPDLSHLSGEALDWARQIIAAFPDRPPTKEEFKAWKRKYRRKAEAVHG